MSIQNPRISTRKAISLAQEEPLLPQPVENHPNILDCIAYSELQLLHNKELDLNSNISKVYKRPKDPIVL